MTEAGLNGRAALLDQWFSPASRRGLRSKQKSLRTRTDTRRIAQSTLSAEGYGIYRLSSAVKSGGVSAYQHRLQIQEDMKVLVNDQTQDLELLLATGAFSSEVVLLCCQATEALFEWPRMSHWEELSETANRLYAQVAERSSSAGVDR